MNKSTIHLHLITMSIRPTLLTAMLATLLLVWSCSPKKTEEPVTTDPPAAGSTEIPAITAAYETDSAFQTQLADVYKAYLKLKDALVASDAEATRLSAAGMGRALATVDPDLLTGAARNDWNTFAPELGKPLRTIANAADVEEARTAFSTVSETMWKSIIAFGAGGEAVYHDYCPMALGNKGAFWLNSGEEIRNPYFGASMLDCGYAKEKLN